MLRSAIDSLNDEALKDILFAAFLLTVLSSYPLTITLGSHYRYSTDNEIPHV